jgi:hypothetical protein
VVVENDANAAAWGETRFGAGHGQPHTVTLTVGTGPRRRRGPRRRAGPRRLRRGRRGRPRQPGARRTPLRLRQPRLLGAVRQRPRPGPRGPRAGRPVPRGRPTCCWSSPAASPAPSPAPW